MQSICSQFSRFLGNLFCVIDTLLSLELGLLFIRLHFLFHITNALLFKVYRVNVRFIYVSMNDREKKEKQNESVWVVSAGTRTRAYGFRDRRANRCTTETFLTNLTAFDDLFVHKLTPVHAWDATSHLDAGAMLLFFIFIFLLDLIWIDFFFSLHKEAYTRKSFSMLGSNTISLNS